MCGIIAVLSRPSDRATPAPEWLVEQVSFAVAKVPSPDRRDLAVLLGAAVI